MPTLTLGCVFSDRIEALLDGRVQPQGYGLDVRIGQAQALFKDVLTEQSFDLTEMSLGSHVAAVAAGKTGHLALPVFLSRAFRHSNLYIRKDVGIHGPQDLAGKRVGLMDYAQTAGVWVRGLLADEYGVARESIRWITGGLHTPVLEDRMAITLPPGLSIERTVDTLDALLARGDIDAIISPQAPQCFRGGHPDIARLFADSQAAEIDYFQRTAIFPIMHCVVVRRSLVEADPRLANALYAAFVQGKAMAMADLAHRDYAKLSLPWLLAYGETVRGWVGEPWTYGRTENAVALTAFMRYAAADGLCGADLDLAEVFAPVDEAALNGVS